MINAKKITEKMRQQPNEIHLEEIEIVLKEYGYTLEHRKGHHRYYWNHTIKSMIMIKEDNPLKKVFIMDVLDKIDEKNFC